MKTLASVAAFILSASVASADYSLEILIPAGDGMDRLELLCDYLRADPEYNKPNMSYKECGVRMFLRGAFELNHEKKRQQLRTQGVADLDADDTQFWLDLPLPANGIPPTPPPTPTPTPTPTATPTPTPTATPTG